jgi:hypothetical protein
MKAMIKPTTRTIVTFATIVLALSNFAGIVRPNPVSTQTHSGRVATAPANDNFDNAQLISGTNGTVTGTTVGANKEATEPVHAHNRGGASVWYLYIAPAAGNIAFDTAGSSFDTLLAVYRGADINHLSPIGANDDAAPAHTSTLRVAAKAGDIFCIAVDGYFNSTLGVYDSGSVNLHYSLTAIPANDNFANAQLLPGSAGKMITASNVGATKEANEPGLGSGDARSIWYKWVAPAGQARSYTFTIDNVNQDGEIGLSTVCGLYTGSSVASLTEVTRAFHYGYNRMSFVPVPGMTYYFKVDDEYAEAGTFSFNYGVTSDIKTADFDQDGRADIAVFRPSTGTWYSLDSITGTMRSTQFGANGDKPLLANIDHDGKLDYIVYRPSTGTWYLQESFGSVAPVSWGLSTDIPVLNHVNETAFLNVFRPSEGMWYESNEYGSVHVNLNWGINGDIPIAMDLAGNGEDQRTVFRPSNGTWYSSGEVNLTLQFGMNGDKPVPADYDGDGKQDVAVFRPSTGTWYIRRSSDGTVSSVQWGQSGDVPQPADFDGDGKSDPAVFRAGTWYILQSSSGGLRSVQFGLAGDIPVTSPNR